MNESNDKIPFWQLWGARPEERSRQSSPVNAKAGSVPNNSFVIAFRMLAILTLVTGVIYPVMVTFVAQAIFPHQANGSIVTIDGKIVGSELLAQNFTNAAYFWPRPSAAEYATIPSGASNKGPTAGDLRSNVAERIASFRTTHKLATDGAVPSDMLFASGSGLDPHISPEAARIEIARVAAARQFTSEQKEKLATLVEQSIERPQLGFLGEPRVNVLKLNLALNQIH